MSDLGFFGALSIIAFFGGVALLTWVTAKAKAEGEKFKHAERLKAMELGQTLPDAEVARANSEAAKAWAAGTVGLVVTPGLLIIALVATLMLLSWQAHMTGGEQSTYDLREVPPILYAIWGICGLVSMMTAIMSMTAVATVKARAGDKGPGKPLGRPLGDEIRVGARS